MRWYDPTPQARHGFTEWVATRPEHLREGIAKLPPWRLYRMSTGHRVTIHSYGECRCGGEPGCEQKGCEGGLSLTVNVTGKFNRVTFSRQVFGIAPSELVECNLPEEGELLGELMDQDEARDYIASLRGDPAA